MPLALPTASNKSLITISSTVITRQLCFQSLPCRHRRCHGDHASSRGVNSRHSLPAHGSRGKLCLPRLHAGWPHDMPCNISWVKPALILGLMEEGSNEWKQHWFWVWWKKEAMSDISALILGLMEEGSNEWNQHWFGSDGRRMQWVIYQHWFGSDGRRKHWVIYQHWFVSDGRRKQWVIYQHWFGSNEGRKQWVKSVLIWV